MTGTVNLIRTGVPVTATFAVQGASLYYTFDSYAETTSLDGSIDLWSDLCGINRSWTIFSWEGLAVNSTQLMNGSACL